MRVLEILVKFALELNLKAEANPLWVREGKNDALVQIVLKDPRPALIKGFKKSSA